MILPLLALLQDVAPAVPTEEEITVIARKMRFIQVDMKAPRRHGRLVLERCRISRPSGHAELDAIPCAAAQECIAEGPETRKQLGNCVESKSQGRLDAVVAAWRARR
jgi:hypothetical protein